MRHPYRRTKAQLSSECPQNGNQGFEERVQVVTRCRPLSASERQKGHTAIVKGIQDVDSEDHSTTQSIVEVSDSLDGKRCLHFRCDRYFGEHTTQATFFDECGVTTLLDRAIAGYSATIFAYGQTGAGKTHTMIGSQTITHEHQPFECSAEDQIALSSYPSNGNNSSPPKAKNAKGGNNSVDGEGLLFRSIRYLYRELAHKTQQCKESGECKKFTVRLSCLEIYNDQVYDLLTASRSNKNVTGGVSSLSVREGDGATGFYVEGLRVIKCHSAGDCFRICGKALQQRRISSHLMNARSNRSHCMFTFYLDGTVSPQSQLDMNVEEDKPMSASSFGKVVFVDLAGSERLKETGSKGSTLLESGQINKSLYILGKVIKQFNDPNWRASRSLSSQGRFLHSGGDSRPATNNFAFRECKLTKLLKDSLGGKSLALMIACASLSSRSKHETLRTLKFAMGVKNIRNTPVVLLDPHEKLVQQLKTEIRRLRQENSLLRKGGKDTDDLGMDGGRAERAGSNEKSSNARSHSPISLPVVSVEPTPAFSPRGKSDGSASTEFLFQEDRPSQVQQAFLYKPGKKKRPNPGPKRRNKNQFHSSKERMKGHSSKLFPPVLGASPLKKGAVRKSQLGAPNIDVSNITRNYKKLHKSLPKSTFGCGREPTSARVKRRLNTNKNQRSSVSHPQPNFPSVKIRSSLNVYSPPPMYDDLFGDEDESNVSFMPDTSLDARERQVEDLLKGLGEVESENAALRRANNQSPSKAQALFAQLSAVCLEGNEADPDDELIQEIKRSLNSSKP